MAVSQVIFVVTAASLLVVALLVLVWFFAGRTVESVAAIGLSSVSESSSWSPRELSGAGKEHVRALMSDFEGRVRIEDAENVFAVVLNKTSVSVDKMTMATCFFEDLNIDSMDMVDLVMEWEWSVEVNIPDHVAERLHSIKDVFEHIAKEKPYSPGEGAASDGVS